MNGVIFKAPSKLCRSLSSITVPRLERVLNAKQRSPYLFLQVRGKWSLLRWAVWGVTYSNLGFSFLCETRDLH